MSIFKNDKIRDILKLVLSNIIVLLSSVMVTFLAPYVLDVPGYGFYKVFTFYLAYTIYLNIGIIDGIYLRYGSKDLHKLPKSNIALLFKSLMGFLLVLFVLGTVLGYFVLTEENLIILVAILFNMFFVNINIFFQVISQITLKFGIVSIQLALNKIVLLVGVVLLFFLDVEQYTWFILVYTLSNVVCGVIYVFYFKDLVFRKTSLNNRSLSYIWGIIKIGIWLLLANATAMLVIGLGNMATHMFLPFEDYSYYSFATTLIAIILVLTTSLSKIIYPNLSRISEEKSRVAYHHIENIIMYIAVFAIPFLFLGNLFIKEFLPEYTDSIPILFLMSYIVIFRLNIVFVKKSYLELMKKQKTYVLFNFTALIVGIIITSSTILIFSDVIAVAIASYITFVIWYFMFEVLFRKLNYSISWKKNVFMFSNMIFSGVLLMMNIGNLLSFGLSSIWLLIMLFVFRKELYRLKEFVVGDRL